MSQYRMLSRVEVLLVFLGVFVFYSLGAKPHQTVREVDYRYERVSDFNSGNGWAKKKHDNDQKSEKGQRQRHNKHALRLLAGLSDESSQSGGLWPSVFNVALKASIAVNATCGQNGREEYCKLVDAHPMKVRGSQCGICDAKSPDQEKRHPITHAIDKSSRWWQSPTLSNGPQYEQVTITLDLGQVYQVLYLMIRAGISPRPAAWIWERSLDGENYAAWQYFASSVYECEHQFGMPGHTGKYVFQEDTEVICSTQFGKVLPLENGEIHVSLINGRPGANSSSAELLDFSMARYIRLRFMRMHSTVKAGSVEWQLDDKGMAKRSFYSVKSIRIGGRCVCSGHGNQCHNTNPDDVTECTCRHNTCGANCERCCPLFNQHPYRPGNATHANECEMCQCHGHATYCRYSPEVHQKGLSVNMHGEISGGGECIDCEHFTTGVNCEKCLPGFYRPHQTPPDAKVPCIPCECHPLGALETCNALGGECVCREGFSGPKCDRCARGHHGENCTRCQCDPRGTMPGGECESHCQCKLHVEGEKCDQCSYGYFSLSSTNPEGCLKCFCSGVGVSCKSSSLTAGLVSSAEEWRMSDLSQSIVAYPSRDNATGYLFFGLYEMPEVESIYWVAPKIYCGNLLSSYGSRFLVSIAWVIVRGDTSGKPTSGPNIIIVGRNGMKIAFGDDVFRDSNTTLETFLTEDGWYHVPRSIKDIVTRLRRTEYRGDPVTRIQFMSVLSDVENILIRGTFHTDQVESVLEAATLFSGETILSDQSLVEQCECPLGYVGSSCEACAFGFVRILENSSTHEKLARCIPCDCNGHAETCDFDTGKCSQCLHNTAGDRCERCALGFYGNPLAGNPDDCKRCACPLLDSSNNFSPSCQLKNFAVLSNFSTQEYICTQCPLGYTGNHCEICDDGFFGEPTELDGECLPCSCSGGPCHPITGRCIICLGNTEGWQCERCKPGYWGDPELGCDLCECYQNGSISNICEPGTGQCLCHSRFSGLKCDECAAGFGNASLDCPACLCNMNGSSAEICDPNTGQCVCKSGVEGLKCDQCMETYHGLGENGCQECLCNRHGSSHLRCNPATGQCKCKVHVTGKSCDRCEDGFYNLEAGCRPCECSELGSKNNICNIYTGQCHCKQGVTGQLCDICQEDHYGFSEHGCKKCDSCPTSSYVCDQETGRCVCPPLSKGAECNQCTQNAWGWQHRLGCRACECDKMGSIGQSCDTVNGQCSCREGFFGRTCNQCSLGYFGYPHCTRCNCDVRGSVRKHWLDVIECDHLGQCPCKELVTGLKCDQCRQATFGLSTQNYEGCTRCYCFGRSQECTQSHLSWGQIRQAGARNLSVEYITPFKPLTEDYDYVIVIQMEGATVHKEDADIEKIGRVSLIPSSTGNVSIGSYIKFHHPLYFQLPPTFFGDQTRSYGGFLQFTLTTEGCDTKLSEDILRNYPLVQIHSHGKFVIEYFGQEIYNTSPNVTFKVPISERFWVHRHFNLEYNVTRGMMMTALQDIQHIFVRGTTLADVTQVVISNISLDTGIFLAGSTNNIALGVEICECPESYDGHSCQNPSEGFYRWKNVTDVEISTNLEEIVGFAIPCSCNGRSEKCDRETGICLKCRENTGGHHCESCAEGFYGNPNSDLGCLACPCPETRKNFARGCHVHNKVVSCICKPGYTGLRCERCLSGFFGTPDDDEGFCEACECNLEGIISSECDEKTGQCNCRPGITGRRCDQCLEERHVIQNGRCRLCDNCTLTLLDSADDIGELLDSLDVHINSIEIVAPWATVEDFETESDKLIEALERREHAMQTLQRFNDTRIDKMTSRANNIFTRGSKLPSKMEKRRHAVDSLKSDAESLFELINNIGDKILNTIDELNSYGTHDHHTNLQTALSEANEYLQQIRDSHIGGNSVNGEIPCWQRQYSDWLNMSKLAKQQMKNLRNLRAELLGFGEKFDQFMDFYGNTSVNVDKSGDLIEDSASILEGLMEKFNKIAALRDESEKYPYLNKKEAFDVMANEINENAESLERDIDDMDLLCDKLNGTLADADEKLFNLEEYILPKAKIHAEELMKKAQRGRDLFQDAKEGAERALKAVTVYKNITQLVEEAKTAAKETKDAAIKAQSELSPSGNVSLVERATNSLEDSQDIIEEAVKEKRKIEGLKESLEAFQDVVKNTKHTVFKTGVDNNRVMDDLSTLSNVESMNTIRGMKDTAEKISTQMQDVHRIAENMNSGVYLLKAKLQTLQPDWEADLGFAQENVSVSTSSIKAATSMLLGMEKMAEKNNEIVQNWNDTLSAQLKALKDKIARAKHAAEGIRVSIESDAGDCKRSYMPQTFGLTTSNTIKMSIALNRNINDSSLIFIQGEDQRFIAVEMVKSHIRLVWNLGGKTTIVTHPVEMQHKDPKLDEAWYQIEANRTMNIGSLTVRQMTQYGTYSNSSVETGDSGIEYTRFSLSPANRVWIGGVPKDIRPPQLINREGLGVTLYQLYIDDKQYGLWHFAHSEGECGGAMLGPQQSTSTINSRYFNGEGYSVVKKTRPKPYRRTLFSVQMQFRTRDENALLFLTVDEKNNRSISLTLHEGRIVFRIDYGGEIKLEINTTKKFNTGEWVNVAAAREFSKGSTENGSLIVDKENHTGSPTAPIGLDSLPHLSNTSYYLGGVPPGFKSGTSKAPGADHAFLGCMKDIQINQETYDPLDSSNYFGVEPSCKENIARGGFHGDGYVELPSHTLNRVANFAFVFRTLQPECLLLLGGYPGRVLVDYDEKDLRGNYSVWLQEGHVNLWINAGSGGIHLTSEMMVNDGEYHVVSVTKTKRKLQLRVDDKLQASKHLPNASSIVTLPGEEGGLFLGGVPLTQEFDDLPPTEKIGLMGSIQDIVFNNDTVSLGNPVNFEGVELGRTGPSMGLNGHLHEVLLKTEPIGKSFTPSPEGCHRVGSYSYEPNAFKFGDGPRSHSILNIPGRHMWQKNFNIQFDFRTFYPNGVLFVAPGSKEKQKHYVVLTLRDGHVLLVIRGRRREERRLPLKLNDGHWHHVSLSSVDRKATLSVEAGGSRHNSSAQLKLPKRISAANVLSIGGIPENSLLLPTEMIAKLEEFKGCIRRFSVNNVTQDLARPGKHLNIGQCFPRIEKGSYFPGDAYATYKRVFHVGKYLEFVLDFRTSELNGILLSVSEPVGYPALSLEVFMGKVVMSCDFGNGNPIRVETDLPSKFALCDNQWHTVSALYDSEQLALRIDNQPMLNNLASLQPSNISRMIHTKSPLHIGGIPENASSGTLLSRENFKGCIRNVMIRGEIRDWTDMDGLTNVLLSECFTTGN
ncbi:laminin subunit alpha lam-3 [Phlebotomus argentipes]|uniref:laminin subunit alpha lam-3 n=1 Tax=Phlebotomus argentipes TaxID=94469 RepID=UPI0028934E1A|nr:laminin subunit alpha lam-3 [Phlebotomus argentipes]